MSKTITVKMARPSADEVESLWKLFHATEAAEDRWNRESSEQFLERLDDQDISDEERTFIAVAWDSLVQGHGGFGRFMGAYDTLIYNFQDPDADHVATHPKLNALFTESQLLPVVLDGYTDARNTIIELENERDAALNTCTLIAEALGITGAVAGDTISRVRQLVAESAVMLKLLTDISENHSEFVDENEDCMCASVPLDYVSEINAYVSRDVNAENPFPATDAAIIEYLAKGTPDGYQLFLIPLEQTAAFRAACTTAYEESLNGTGPCGIFMAGYRAMLASAPQFAASLRGGE